MLDSEELVHTAVLERYTGDSATGAAYDAPVNVDGYFEGGNQLLEKPVTGEVGAVGKFYTNETDLPIGSRLSVQGVTGYIGETLLLDDGGTLSHTEVTVTGVPRSEEYRTAVISLCKPATSTWSDADEATTFTAGETYASNLAAQITALITRTSDADRELAEETVTTATYQVTVFHDVEPFEHDLVLVEAYLEDPSLEGRRLRITHVSRGSGVLERRMLCDLLGAPRPS